MCGEKKYYRKNGYKSLLLKSKPVQEGEKDMKRENLKNKKKARKLIKNLLKWYGDYFSAPFYLINKNGGYSLKQAKALQKLLEDALITSPEVKIYTSYGVYGRNYNIFTIMARNQRDWSKIEIGAGVTTDTEYKEEWDEYVPTGIRGIGHWYAARNLLDELSKGEEGKFWVETE